MARYKHIDTSPRFLAEDIPKQLLPGSLAHAVDHLLDHDFNLSSLDARYRNDAAGATSNLRNAFFSRCSRKNGCLKWKPTGPEQEDGVCVKERRVFFD
jgi:hypothetical protein